MRAAAVVWSVTLMGCLPRAQPAQPAQPAPLDGEPSAQRAAMRSPSRDASGGATLLGQAPMSPQPSPAQPPQPYPAPAQPYPAPAQPYPAQQPPYPAQPYPAQPAQPYPAQPYGAPPYGAPQPYPAAGQPPTPYPPAYPPAQQYTAVQQYPAPAGAVDYATHSGDREVILDFAMLGTLSSINLLVHSNVDNGSAGTLLVFSGVAAGGAAGWLLTENYNIRPAAGRMSTLGLLIGAANGALLIQPSDTHDGGAAFGLISAGSAVGMLGGLIYGQNTDLSSGQSTFVGNLVLLGSATAATTAIIGSRDDKYGGWENTALLLGLDGGVLAGALIAPGLHWSAKRSKIVFASTVLGAFVAGSLAAALQKQDSADSGSGDLVTGCMTAGMWAGFGLAILTTQNEQPDIRVSRSGPGSAVTLAPYAGERGQIGMLAGGTW